MSSKNKNSQSNQKQPQPPNHHKNSLSDAHTNKPNVKPANPAPTSQGSDKSGDNGKKSGQ
jgi:hypothetical protein